MNDKDQLRMLFTATLSQMSRVYKTAADRVASSYGLSQATAWAALTIGRLGNRVRPNELAEALGLDPSSIVRTVDQLIDAGFVERSEDPQDRRAKILRLTAKGEKTVHDVEMALVDYRGGLLKSVPVRDLKVCLRVLTSLKESIKEREPA